MINTKETLKKLHKKFPLLSLDELFDILDCYVDDSCLWTRDITRSSEPSPRTVVKTTPYTTTITSNEDLNENKIIAVNNNFDGMLRAN